MPESNEHLAELARAAMERVIDPELRRPITELGMLRSVEVDDAGSARIGVLLTIAGCPLRGTITADVERELAGVPGITSVHVDLDVMSPAQREELKEKLRGPGGARGVPFSRPGSLTKVYAVASGKGGVGKSTVTVNLAAAMAASGLRVGVVDADVHGFSVPGLLGITAPPTRVDEMILPPVAYGIKTISIGMFLDKNQPVAWRGPMLHRALEQFLTDVYFGDLDVLLLDLPPGTGRHRDFRRTAAALFRDPGGHHPAGCRSRGRGTRRYRSGPDRAEGGGRHREHVLADAAHRRTHGALRLRRRRTGLCNAWAPSSATTFRCWAASRWMCGCARAGTPGFRWFWTKQLPGRIRPAANCAASLPRWRDGPADCPG